MHRPLSKWAFLGLAALSLAACGGGGGAVGSALPPTTGQPGSQYSSSGTTNLSASSSGRPNANGNSQLSVTSITGYDSSTLISYAGYQQPYPVGPTEDTAMNFSKGVKPSQLQYTVSASDGSTVSSTFSAINGTTVELQMPAKLGVTYTVKVTSPVTYSYSFYGASSDPSSSTTATPTPAPTSSATPTPAPTSSATSTPAPSSSPTPTPTATPTYGVTSITGYQGSTQLSLGTTQPYHVEYSELLSVNFNTAVTAGSFSYSITGSDGSTPASSTYWMNYGKSVQLTVRKVPGIVYTVKITAPVVYTFTFTTPSNPPVPAPSLSTLGQPYRYGVLEHPFPFSLGDETCSTTNGVTTCTLNSDSQEQVNLLCNAHVRFVRIDYVASQILDPSTTLLATPNFAQEDAIMNALAQCGITELPIIVQYSAGPVLTAHQSESWPMQWAAQSQEPVGTNVPGYADFAAMVVQHVMQKYPQITRVELFNEPNLSGWGNFPVNGSYSTLDRSGMEAAGYMKAAYAAIKAVDPSMTVVGPALADGGTDTDPRKFLQTMYSNGCKTGVCWDRLSVHNYDWENPTFYKSSGYQNQWGIYEQLQQVAMNNGDVKPNVMLTEWGYSNQTASQYAFDPQVQAEYLALGLNLMLADPTLDGIVYVNVYNPGTDFWGRTSLTDTSYNPLPGYYTLQAFASY